MAAKPVHIDHPQLVEHIKAEMPDLLQALAAVFKKGFAGSKKITSKASFRDLVTDTDHAIEALFTTWVGTHFPGHNVVGEETASMVKEQGWEWCIDPVDGTTNFVHGLPDCAIIIAVLHDGVPTMGWILYPMLGKLFFAEKGKGTFLNGERLTSLKNTSLGNALLTTLDQSNFAILAAIVAPVCSDISGLRIGGCAASVYCAVAAGQIQIGVLPESYIWEHVAGCLLVSEVGGIVSTLSGGNIVPAAIEQDIAMACSPMLLDSITSAISSFEGEIK